MRTLSIRSWLLLGWISTVLLVNLLFSLLEYLQGESDAQRGTRMQTVGAAVMEGTPRWADPRWQHSLQSVLGEQRGLIILRDSDGRELYRSAGDLPDMAPNQVIVVVDGARRVGEAAIFLPEQPSTPWIEVATALFSFVLLMGGLGWFITQTVLRPLAAMSSAARRIAAGNLDVDVPDSRVREVTEVAVALRAMGDGLRASLQRQAEIEQERRLFVSAIAHDLRTPLFALRGYLDGWARGLATTPEKAAYYLAVCQEQALTLDRRVAALFTYARLELLEQAPQRVPVAWSDLLERTITRLVPLLERKTITLALPHQAPAQQIQGDAELLARVLENLLDNAIRHTPEGGRVTIDWWQSAGRFWFTISDSGPGIAAEQLTALFTPAYRQMGQGGSGSGGAGLGLTIARRIMHLHDGNLAVANAEHGGVLVTGFLPLE